MTDDYRANKLNKTQARKKIAEILQRHPDSVRFSRHALEELNSDDLTTVVAFQADGNGLFVVTAWDKRRKGARK